MSDSVWLTEDQQRAWRSYLALHKALIPRLNAHLQSDSGVSSADYPILVALSEAPAGRARAAALGRETGWEKSRLSHHLDRMEQRGLLRREECAQDTRYSDIVLTSAGRAAIEAAAPLHAAHVREWFVEAMAPDQLAAFGEMCEAIVSRVGLPSDDSCPVGRQAAAGAAD